MAGLEHRIDPLEYVFKGCDVIHMDNLLVYLKDSRFIFLTVKRQTGLKVWMSKFRMGRIDYQNRDEDSVGFLNGRD